MNTITKRACSRALMIGIGTFLTVGGLQASLLWNNGFASANSPGQAMQTPGLCDSLCGSPGAQVQQTIFDNFNTTGNGPWLVSGFNFSDFLVAPPGPPLSAPANQQVTWSLWLGNPLSGGTLVANSPGAVTATISSLLMNGGNNGAYGCSANICLENYNVVLGTSVSLSANQTYYLGVTVSSTSSYNTFRADTNGNGLGGSQGTISGYVQSNGSINGQGWSSNSSSTFGSPDTVFDIQGIITPEPATWSMLLIAAAGLFFVRRRIA